MATCWSCGSEIAFRWIGGRLIPIHLDGGWCSTGQRENPEHASFRDIDSYVNPNAICPVCGDRVFFFQSRFGGRVFFDALGWPWPKHPCTDNSGAQSGQVRALSPTRFCTEFLNKRHQPLDIFELIELTEDGRRIRALFRKSNDRREFWASANTKLLAENGISPDDFKDAPSFIFRRDAAMDECPVVEFISARAKKILRIRMRRD